MTFLFDMGLPMIFPAMYFMTLALIPIILIEAVALSKSLGLRFRQTVGSATFANIISTLVGIPITWLLLFFLQIITGGTSSYGVRGFWGKLLSVTLQAPWLLPSGNDQSWIFFAAALFLLIPFFFATWIIEYVMVRNSLASRIVEASTMTVDIAVAERLVFRSVKQANLLSYGLIAALLIVSWVTSK